MNSVASTSARTQVFISVGSNVDAAHNVLSSLDTLGAELEDCRCAPWYRSPAVGFDGDDFINTVVAGHTALACSDLSARLRAIEDAQGRDRTQPRFSARPLDLDVLLYGDLVQHDAVSDVPRADILEYAFVMQPLVDLAPDLHHPELAAPFKDLHVRMLAQQPESFRALQRVASQPSDRPPSTATTCPVT